MGFRELWEAASSVIIIEQLLNIKNYSIKQFSVEAFCTLVGGGDALSPALPTPSLSFLLHPHTDAPLYIVRTAQVQTFSFHDWIMLTFISSPLNRRFYCRRFCESFRSGGQHNDSPLVDSVLVHRKHKICFYIRLVFSFFSSNKERNVNLNSK